MNSSKLSVIHHIMSTQMHEQSIQFSYPLCDSCESVFILCGFHCDYHIKLGEREAFFTQRLLRLKEKKKNVTEFSATLFHFLLFRASVPFMFISLGKIHILSIIVPFYTRFFNYNLVFVWKEWPQAVNCLIFSVTHTIL